MRAFKRAVSDLGCVFAADCDPTAPALFAADRGYILPKVSSPEYGRYLLELCLSNEINLVVPLIDPELPVLAREKATFLKHGIVLAVSDENVISIANDKLLTAQFFSSVGVPSPVTVDAGSYLTNPEIWPALHFPVVVKPKHGSAGQGMAVCFNHKDMEYCCSKLPEGEAIIQEHLSGSEVTIDVFSDGSGNLIELVPRRRLKVRGGEVERGVTVDCGDFINYVASIVRALKPYGVINIQCFVTPTGPVFTEINARFGGGYPLADAAGACFPEMLVQLALGESIIPRIGQYKRNIVMTRYDSAFYARMEDVQAHVWKDMRREPTQEAKGTDV